MRLLYLLVAEDFVVDQFLNSATAIKIVERLALRQSGRVFQGSRGFDWRAFRFCALVVFQSDHEGEPSGEFSVSLRTPLRDVELGKRPYGFSRHRVSRSRIEFPGVPDDGSGEYAIVIRYAQGIEEAKAEWTFDVRLVDPIAAEGATSEAPPLRPAPKRDAPPAEREHD